MSLILWAFTVGGVMLLMGLVGRTVNRIFGGRCQAYDPVSGTSCGQDASHGGTCFEG